MTQISVVVHHWSLVNSFINPRSGQVWFLGKALLLILLLGINISPSTSFGSSATICNCSVALLLYLKSIAIGSPTIPTMGSCPEGTKCVYCGVHEASYIPDGCIGPMCLHDGGCHDMWLENGASFENEYMKRCWLAKVRPLRQANHQLRNLGQWTLTHTHFEQTIAVNIAKYLFDF
jgi:hypothetical protein